MNHKISIIFIILITILYLYFAVISISGEGMIINILVLAVMLGICIFGIKDLIKLNKFNCALEKYKETTRDDGTSPALTDAIKKYDKACNNIKDKKIIPSLNNYINEDLYRLISNADYNEFVPNALTGIGILGTFLGLTIGLQNFDAQTADAMYGSIMPLIEGIKVAFYTSILGVALSVVYNLLLKSLFGKADKLVNNFENKNATNFEEHDDAKILPLVLDALKNDLPTILSQLPNNFANELGQKLDKNNKDLSDAISNQLTKFHQETTDQLNNNFIIANELGQKLDKNNKDLSDAISNQLTKFHQETTNQLNNNFIQLTKATNDYVTDLGNTLTKNLVAVQTDGTNQLIDKFTQNMNTLLNSDFQNLKTGIEGIASWEQKLSTSLKDWVPAMNDSIQKLAQNHKDWDAIATKIEILTNECREQRESLSKQMELITKQKESLTEQANAFFISFKEMNEIMQENVRNIISLGSDIITKQKETFNEQAVACIVSFKEMNEIMQENAQNIISMGNDINEAYQAQLQTIQSIQKNTEENNDIFLNQIQSAVQNIETASDHIKQSCKTTENQVSQQLKLVSENHIESCKRLNETFSQISHETETASTHLSTAFSHLKTIYSNTSNQLEQTSQLLTQSFTSLSQTAAQTQNNSEEFKKEYEAMLESCKKLNQEINDSIHQLPEQYQNINQQFSEQIKQSHEDSTEIKNALTPLSNLEPLFNNLRNSIDQLQTTPSSIDKFNETQLQILDVIQKVENNTKKKHKLFG